MKISSANGKNATIMADGQSRPLSEELIEDI
jgi:hypothetical protein